MEQHSSHMNKRESRARDELHISPSEHSLWLLQQQGAFHPSDLPLWMAVHPLQNNQDDSDPTHIFPVPHVLQTEWVT